MCLYYTETLLPTKVFAKSGLDNVTSAMCKQQHRFGLTFINLAFSCYLQHYIFNWGICTGLDVQ
jgi:hypothetical protein